LEDKSIEQILDDLAPDGEFEDEDSEEDTQGKKRRKQ